MRKVVFLMVQALLPLIAWVKFDTSEIVNVSYQRGSVVEKQVGFILVSNSLVITVYIRTVSSYNLLSSLINWFKLGPCTKASFFVNNFFSFGRLQQYYLEVIPITHFIVMTVFVTVQKSLGISFTSQDRESNTDTIALTA